MDNLSLFIIVVSVVLALLFKWYLFRRIRQWIDQDLIKGLAAGDAQQLHKLTTADTAWREAGMRRAERHRRLEQLASENSTPNQPASEPQH